MLAIYKKELRAYFTSFLGYMFIAFLLIIVGICQDNYNLTSKYANFAYAIQGSTFLFVVLIPLLTMRILAEEKRQKTDQLLFTSPVSITKIILGKYFALISVFGIAVLCICAYPLILRHFGPTNLSIAYTSIAAYFLLGCAYMSIGMFISALTESQVFSAVLTIIVILFTLLIDMLVNLLPTGHLLALIVFIALVLLIAVILYVMMKSLAVSGIFAVLGIGALVAVYISNPILFDGSLGKTFGWLSIISRFSNVVYGICNVSVYVYYISICFLFVLLTIQAIKKRRWEA